MSRYEQRAEELFNKAADENREAIALSVRAADVPPKTRGDRTAGATKSDLAKQADMHRSLATTYVAHAKMYARLAAQVSQSE